MREENSSEKKMVLDVPASIFFFINVSKLANCWFPGSIERKALVYCRALVYSCKVGRHIWHLM